MFAHVLLIRRRDSEMRLWDLMSAGFPHSDDDTRDKIRGLAEGIGKCGRRRLSAFEVADADTRIEMIGAELRRYGAAWLSTHPAEREFLLSAGVSIEAALARDADWRERTAERWRKFHEARQQAQAQDLAAGKSVAADEFLKERFGAQPAADAHMEVRDERR